MSKFNGSEEDFITLLNKATGKSFHGETIGNQFRYIFEHTDNKTYNINLFKTGTVQIQPDNEEVREIVDRALSETYNVHNLNSQNNKEIFIVHGHNLELKDALKLILYEWDIKPFAIQDEDSKGKTIIEFLENEIQKHSVSIILLTPDDMGYSTKEGEENRKPRARQNVILELGMLIGAIGRSNCIILRQSSVETPSDINGLIYIPFDQDLTEIKEKLKNKLESLGIRTNKKSVEKNTDIR